MCYIMQESCVCCCKLAKAIPTSFHRQSEGLSKPLLKSMVHQHSKVRVACIKVRSSLIVLVLLATDHVCIVGI